MVYVQMCAPITSFSSKYVADEINSSIWQEDFSSGKISYYHWKECISKLSSVVINSVAGKLQVTESWDGLGWKGP